MMGELSNPTMACSKRTDPNPLWLGLATGGPPRSRHPNCSLGEDLFCTIRQDTATVPTGVAKAPYLEALVASSWVSKANDWAALGLSMTVGPSMLIVPAKLANWPLTISSSAAPRPAASVRSPWALAKACKRD